jgi:hypothetical protein
MADIEKLSSEASNLTESITSIVNPLTVDGTVEQSPTTEAVPTFIGVFYGAPFVAEMHVGDEIALFLQKHAPAYNTGGKFLYAVSTVIPKLVIIPDGKVGTRTAGGGPPVPPPSTTHLGESIRPILVHTERQVNYKHHLLLISGMSTLDKETQMLYVSPSSGVINVGNITSPTFIEITIKNTATFAQTP